MNPARCSEKAAEKAGKDAAQAQLDLSEAEDDAADAEKALELRNWEVQGGYPEKEGNGGPHRQNLGAVATLGYLFGLKKPRSLGGR